MPPDENPQSKEERPLSEDEKPRTIVGLTRLVAEGKAHVRPSYHEVTAIGITLVILVLGYLWGSYTDPHNFTRAGELIVVTGIIFAGLDLTGRLSLVDEWMVARLERIRPVIVPGWGKRGQEQAQEKIERREILEENVTSGVKEATDKARSRLHYIEISILILGSLICGFGDLVVVHWKF
jgi:hypothetical protein